ncbi:invasion associated locus B family protein [Methylopila musalis]|uniref:Invasion associated locus B family protein n=1 Tax=Methylopila musalis TaxID=1134781 RepID=A0ABW3Z314_9HYPH
MTARPLATLAAALLMAAQMEIPMAQAQTQQQTQAGPRLPNGATSLNETYQDWAVACAAGDKGRVCVMSQRQRKTDTSQLVLAAEFDAVSAGSVKGALVLPFGLRLADGVVAQIDDRPALKALPFATCLPAGCIVPVVFDGDALKALRSGTTLKLTAKAHDTGRNVAFGVSLKGFAAAQDRVAALSAQ